MGGRRKSERVTSEREMRENGGRGEEIKREGKEDIHEISLDLLLEMLK